MALALLAAVWGGGANAGDLLAAPPGASACSGCHSAAPGAAPALAGRAAGEIAEAMRAFRSGARAGTLMNRIAKGFSEEEIRAVASWVAAP